MKKTLSTLQQLELGQIVQLATLPNLLFKIQAKHSDGSYQITTHLDAKTELGYDHVCREMLRVVEIPSNNENLPSSYL